MKTDAEYIAEMKTELSKIPSECNGLDGSIAYRNAFNWLMQAANGEVPHGGMEPFDHSTLTRTDYTQAERPGAND